MSSLSLREAAADEAAAASDSAIGERLASAKGLGGKRGSLFGSLLYAALLLTAATLTTIVVTVPLERETVGLLVLGLTVVCMFLGIHVSVSMALPSLLGLWILGGERGVAYALESVPRSSAASWTMSVVPMFVLMGIVLYQTGVSAAIFDAARQWIGKLPGGLAIATIFAGAGMSAASGSTLGVTYTTSRMGIPEMLKSGYSPRLATGTVAVAGVLKMLIPPSVTVVIYAGIASTPVGPQLLAGIIPGILLAILFAGTVIVHTAVNPKAAPPIDMSEFTWRSRIQSLVGIWPVALLVTIIVGGLYLGVTTATEAGAAAALVAILIGAWLSRNDGMRAFCRRLASAFALTVSAVAAIMMLIVSVTMLTLFMSLSGLVQHVSGFVADLGLSRVSFLLVLVVMYVVMGMFMDELAMMLLTVPVLIPVLESYDIDLTWFGVFVILLCEVGMVVPPVGFLSFVVHGIAQDPQVNLGTPISLVDVYRGVTWFVLAALGLIVVLIFVPDLALWLPSLQGG